MFKLAKRSVIVDGNETMADQEGEETHHVPEQKPWHMITGGLWSIHSALVSSEEIVS